MMMGATVQRGEIVALPNARRMRARPRPKKRKNLSQQPPLYPRIGHLVRSNLRFLHLVPVHIKNMQPYSFSGLFVARVQVAGEIAFPPKLSAKILPYVTYSD